MEGGHHAFAFSQEFIELFACIACRSRYQPDIESLKLFGNACIDLHLPRFSLADDERLGRFRKHCLNILKLKLVALPSPPAGLHSIRIDYQILLIFLSINMYFTEGVLFDFFHPDALPDLTLT